jgi:DNA excision repair protein ERCC-4
MIQAKKSLVEILVDDRERDDKLLIALQLEGNTIIRKCRLAKGDYLLENLLVERKTILDLCISITDGRLFRQAAQLALADVQPLIILEGTSSDLKNSGMKRETIQGALIILALIFKIPVLRSISPEETAKLILYAARQIENTAISQQVYPQPFRGRKRFNKKQKMQTQVLQGFPGIGPARSKLLLNKFGKLSAIFNASAKELAEIPGIGKKAIKRIFDVLN